MPSCVNIPARGHKRPVNDLSAGRMMRYIGITLANKGKEFVKRVRIVPAADQVMVVDGVGKEVGKIVKLQLYLRAAEAGFVQIFGYFAALCKEAGKIARGLEYCAGAFGDFTGYGNAAV